MKNLFRSVQEAGRRFNGLLSYRPVPEIDVTTADVLTILLIGVICGFLIGLFNVELYAIGIATVVYGGIVFCVRRRFWPR